MYRLTTLRWVAMSTVIFLLSPTMPLGARSRKGDRLLAEARVAEGKQEWDKALLLAEQAIVLDASDPGYMLEVRRVRFEAATFHITNGQKLREAGKLSDALAEFEHAYQIDPSSDIADQELRRTKLMIEREKKRGVDPNAASLDPGGSLTPAQESRKRVQDKVDSLMSVPDLKPLSTDPIQLRMSNSKPKVLFETVGKIAGINVLFDPEYESAGAGKTQSIDLNGTTLNEALDYLAVVTHSFWKPMSPNHLRHAGKPHQAARIRRPGGEGFLSFEHHRAAGAAGSHHHPPSGSGSDQAVQLQLAERHHRKGRTGAHGAGREDYR